MPPIKICLPNFSHSEDLTSDPEMIPNIALSEKVSFLPFPTWGKAGRKKEALEYQTLVSSL